MAQGVIANDNEKLLQPLHNDEVKDALFQIEKFKALGPDGLEHLFSKTIGILLKWMFVLWLDLFLRKESCSDKLITPSFNPQGKYPIND